MGPVRAEDGAAEIVQTLRSLYHAEVKHSDVIEQFVEALYTQSSALVQQPLSPAGQLSLSVQLQQWQIQSR